MRFRRKSQLDDLWDDVDAAAKRVKRQVKGMDGLTEFQQGLRIIRHRRSDQKRGWYWICEKNQTYPHTVSGPYGTLWGAKRALRRSHPGGTEDIT